MVVAHTNTPSLSDCKKSSNIPRTLEETPPSDELPVSPGKNITVISEVISMNHMLKVYGENTAQRFIQKLSDDIARRKTTLDYLEADME